MTIKLRERAAAGYTLLEALVVLTLMALVANAGLAIVPQRSERLRIDRTTSSLVRSARAARSLAITTNDESILAIDIERRIFAISSEAPHFFDADLDVTVKIGGEEKRGSGAGQIRFFPDGSSTGGEIGLAANGYIARICVNWLTGRSRNAVDC